MIHVFRQHKVVDVGVVVAVVVALGVVWCGVVWAIVGFTLHCLASESVRMSNLAG